MSTMMRKALAMRDPRREVPAVGELLESERMRSLVAEHGRAVVKDLLARELDAARAALSAGSLDATGLRDRIARLPEDVARTAERRALSLQPVVNATGVILHTNLGRAPLSVRALSALAARAASYLNVELDLATGERGGRAAGVDEKLRALTGCEASLIVNNNAAAVLLALDTLARGREVIVSRGELVEIGGAFRVPEVMQKSGATLVEVGTTNRTRIGDYERAITERTAALLKVHPSNFRIVGFTEEAAAAELARLAHARGILALFDLGSGALRLPERDGKPALTGESTVREAVAAGFDAVTFSGDKLLGGPQAGIIVGRREVVERLRGNPLYRALRVDKVTALLLEATLGSYERERERDDVPAQRMLAVSCDALEERARAVLAKLGDAARRLGATVVPLEAAMGGGSAPIDRIPSRGLALRPARVSAGALLAWLRGNAPPIVARIEDDAVVIDLRTVFPEHDRDLVTALVRTLPPSSG